MAVEQLATTTARTAHSEMQKLPRKQLVDDLTARFDLFDGFYSSLAAHFYQHAPKSVQSVRRSMEDAAFKMFQRAGGGPSGWQKVSVDGTDLGYVLKVLSTKRDQSRFHFFDTQGGYLGYLPHNGPKTDRDDRAGFSVT